ncbi:hypothetical protein GJ496_007168 [Pomphorhynchus laevis]|nr:hypothetical protein GJ496_007168 [Pomphorhynchus laevis]
MISEKELNDLRLKALCLCRDYLGGTWKNLKEEDLIFSRISGGLSNYLFKCTIPDYIDCKDNPRSVILRVYGQHLVARTSEVLKDTTVSLMLSEWGIGPKVYAVRGSSRLEQFFEAKTLRTSDLRNVTLRNKIARVLAKFHSFEMPLMKEPKWLFETVQNYLQKVKNLNFQNDNEKMMYELLFKKVDLNKEFDDLRAILSEVPSPVLFSHNDVQPGNLLLMESGEIKLIDYEYSGYNYRGFDLGNFFCEFMFDYNCNVYPYFNCNFDRYPSIETQREFIEEYVRSWMKNNIGKQQTMQCNGHFDSTVYSPLIKKSLSKTNLKEQLKNEVRCILKEASYFSLASNFMWAIWSIYLSYESRIDFCYMEYGICRLFAYFCGKYEILKGDLAIKDQSMMKIRPIPNYTHFIGGVTTEGIFGDVDKVNCLKAKCNQWTIPIQQIVEPHVPASLLKLWYRELADPLIPDWLYADWVSATTADQCVQITDKLSTIHRNVMFYLVQTIAKFTLDSLLGCLHILHMLCCAYQIGRQMRVMVDRFICQNSLLHALFWSEESTNLFMGLSWLKDFENLEWITEPTDKSDIIGFILHGSVSIFKLISSKSVKQLNLSYQSECMQTEHHVSKRMKHILKGKSDHNSSNAPTIATTESNDLSVNQQNSLKTTKSDNLEYGQCIAHVKTHGYVFLKYKNKNLFKYRSHGKSYILFIRCKHLSDMSIFGRLIVDKLRVKYNEFMLNSNHTNIDQRDLLNIANAMPYIIDEIDQFVCSKDDFISDKESELHLKHVLTPQMASQYSLFK